MKLLCFDMDNTLVKATKAHLDAYKLAFKKHNLPKKTNKEIYEYLSFWLGFVNVNYKLLVCGGILIVQFRLF